jgi:hypothetical protein
MYYVLRDRVPIPVDMLTWARWFEGPIDQRTVSQEYVGDWWVSTVFLGLDHEWRDGPPVLFETMVFAHEAMAFAHRESADFFRRRYSTWEQASLGHRAIVAGLAGGRRPDELE